MEMDLSNESDDDEGDGSFGAVPLVGEDVLQAILRAKKGDPNLFQSFWEMDEQGVEEATMEEIQNDPSKKILWAAENNYLDIVEGLICQDPGLVQSVDEDLYTPLHRASYNGHVDMVKLLLSRGANIRAETDDGWHPLHSASRWNQVDVMSVLLQSGADINAQTHGGLTALHLAASEKECGDCLKFLLMQGNLDRSLKNKLGETAYDICRRTSENCVLFETADQNLNKMAE